MERQRGVMATTTIRISLRARDVLQELARTSGSSMQAVLEQALEQYRRQQLLEATNAAYAALRASRGLDASGTGVPGLGPDTGR
jgi:predicted transcriptional regulator